MDIQVGPHLYRNTDGNIEVEGVLQMEISLAKSGEPLKVNFAIFDSAGKMPGKLMNSTLVTNERGTYQLAKEPTSLALTDLEQGEEILKIDVKEGDRVVISKGQFYSLKGHLMTITPLEWSVHKTTTKSGETDLKGNPVSLG